MGPRRESRDVGPSRSQTSTCGSRFHPRWEKKGLIDHPSCAPISGETCLKSSRRQSTRGRKKKKKKKERIQKERMGGGETKRKIWEEEENKVEKETKYKQKKI